MSGASRASGVVTLVELLKLLRGGNRTREEVADAMSMHIKSIDAWLSELVANGIAVESRRGGVGNAPKVYTLAGKWGGLG